MNRDEVLGKIDRAAREKATVLYLPENQMSAVPAEIGQLTNHEISVTGGNPIEFDGIVG